MEPLTTYAETLDHLPIDLRAEVVVADMLDDGISLDELIINSLGILKRPFGRDISRVDWEEVHVNGQRQLRIDLNRSGLYDLLPEGVFHQPTSSDASASTESTLREMAIQQEREQQARRFFLPVEQEFFRQRIRIEQEQRALLAGDNRALSDDIVCWFWELPGFLTATQRSRLVHLLPVMHQLAGDLRLMEAGFAQLLNERVSLRIKSPAPDYWLTDTPALGRWQLGADSVFDGWLDDGEPVLCITVHIDQMDRLSDYLPGGVGRQTVDWLAGYLVPLDTNMHLELDTSALVDGFSLTDESAFGRLDFTTSI